MSGCLNCANEFVCKKKEIANKTMSFEEYLIFLDTECVNFEDAWEDAWEYDS